MASPTFARVGARVPVLIEQETMILILGSDSLAAVDELDILPRLVDAEAATNFRLLTAPLMGLLPHATHQRISLIHAQISQALILKSAGRSELWRLLLEGAHLHDGAVVVRDHHLAGLISLEMGGGHQAPLLI